jgi:hypothetical protein
VIRINFAKRLKTPLGGAATGGAGSFSLSSFKLDREVIQAVPWIKIGLLALAIYAAIYGVDGYKQELLQAEDVVLEELTEQKKKLTEKLNEQKNLEQLKITIEKEDAIIRAKLDAIRALMKDRDLPSKILLEISKVTPDQVWIKNLQVDEKKVILSGSSVGFNPLSDFMRNLRGSVYFQDVTLKGSQSTQDKAGEVTTFDLEITRRPAS